VSSGGARLLAVVLAGATVGLVAIGTLWPSKTAAAFASGAQFTTSAGTPEAAVRSLGEQIRAKAYGRAYESLANKGEFSEQQFRRDLTSGWPDLRTYADLSEFQAQPLHATDTDATVRFKMVWSTVVGPSASTKDLHLVKNGGKWQIEWPIQKEPVVPPQVIPVNYLRWDVINRSSADDWGAQDVEAPHVRIVDMHPVQRAEGLVLLGELLNEDVVPAYVSVTATLLSKDQKPIDTEGSFDDISHQLLPKQVTPFVIRFPNVTISQVGSVRMTPFSTLISASADPVIEIQNEKLTPAPDASLTGQLTNQSGQIANVAHVLGTFYDQQGQVVWVGDQYVDHALLPGTPVAFNIHIPEDLARKVSSQRTVVATYSFGGAQ
jgi:hypothetical protein